VGWMNRVRCSTVCFPSPKYRHWLLRPTLLFSG
jgi:hypothetical protein